MCGIETSLIQGMHPASCSTPPSCTSISFKDKASTFWANSFIALTRRAFDMPTATFPPHSGFAQDVQPPQLGDSVICTRIPSEPISTCTLRSNFQHYLDLRIYHVRFHLTDTLALGPSPSVCDGSPLGNSSGVGGCKDRKFGRPSQREYRGRIS